MCHKVIRPESGLYAKNFSFDFYKHITVSGVLYDFLNPQVQCVLK